jgi:putative oxidoreductase
VGDIAIYFAGLQASKYFFLLLKGTEIVCGLFLLTGFFVPLSLVILAPIVLNILMVHLFLEPSGLPMAGALTVGLLYLSFFSPSYSPVIKRLFVAK